MKKLFYVVDKELQSVGDNEGIEETTGNKEITVYSASVDGNGFAVIDREFSVEATNDENSEEVIKGYLDDNGMDTDFELIQL